MRRLTENPIQLDYTDLEVIHIGTPIRSTDIRVRLKVIMDEAQSAYRNTCISERVYGKSDTSRDVPNENALAITNTIGNLPDMTILDPGNFSSIRNLCFHYAFGTRNNEPWATPYSDGADREIDVFRFSNDSLSWLRGKGYSPVSEPETGDIVAYGFFDPRDRRQWSLQHFGVYEGLGQVTSKFAQGPVVSHPVLSVPEVWGNRMVFLRKLAPQLGAVS